MNMIVRACSALASFALTTALFGGEFNVYVDSDQHIDVSVAGSREADIWVINSDTGQTVVELWVAPLGYGYTSSYSYNGGPFQPGPISFVENNSSSGTISGLPSGNYQIIASSSSLMDYASYQSGGSCYLTQTDFWYNDWVDFSFDVW